MQVQGHDSRWVHFWAKKKRIKIEYMCMHDANKISRSRRHIRPFYEELPHFLTTNRVIIIPHTYGTTGGEKELLATTAAPIPGPPPSSVETLALGDNILLPGQVWLYPTPCSHDGGTRTGGNAKLLGESGEGSGHAHSQQGVEEAAQ